MQRSLHQWVETFGRLIEYEEFGIGLQRLHHADLLAHAAAVVAHWSIQDRVGELKRLHHAMAEE